MKIDFVFLSKYAHIAEGKLNAQQIFSIMMIDPKETDQPHPVRLFISTQLVWEKNDTDKEYTLLLSIKYPKKELQNYPLGSIAFPRGLILTTHNDFQSLPIVFTKELQIEKGFYEFTILIHENEKLTNIFQPPYALTVHEYL